MKKIFLIPLLLFVIEGMSAQIYTKGTVYDFNIGDEFHYRISSLGFPSIPNGDYIDRILNRYTNSTHLCYEVGKVSLTNSNVIEDTRIDSIPLSTLSDPLLDTVPSGVLGDMITIEYYIIPDSFLCSSEYLWTNSTLDYPPNYEPPHWLQRFMIGLGEVNYYRSSLSGYISRGLVYYKKGNISCGSEVYITPIENIESNETLRLSPNPFQNQIFIRSNVALKQALQFYLYNNLGQLVLEQTISGNQVVNIPTSKNIPKGVYYGIIHYDNQIQTTKLIRQ
jgi:hypothetical protein